MGKILNYPRTIPQTSMIRSMQNRKEHIALCNFLTRLATLIGTTNSIYVPLDRDVKSTYSYEETRQIFPCEVCSIHLKGKVQLDEHLKSKRHKRMLKHMKKKSKSLEQKSKLESTKINDVGDETIKETG